MVTRWLNGLSAEAMIFGGRGLLDAGPFDSAYAYSGLTPCHCFTWIGP